SAAAEVVRPRDAGAAWRYAAGRVDDDTGAVWAAHAAKFSRTAADDTGALSGDGGDCQLSSTDAGTGAVLAASGASHPQRHSSEAVHAGGAGAAVRCVAGGGRRSREDLSMGRRGMPAPPMGIPVRFHLGNLSTGGRTAASASE